ncbi:MAG: hypothetical protein EOO68_21170, partial [Moraxellaceae bacterium]
MSSSPEQMTIHGLASPGDVIDPQHQLRFDAVYKVDKNVPTLTAVMSVDQHINLELNTHILRKNEDYWLGSLKGAAAYLDPWWIPHLNAWNIKIDENSTQIPGAASSTLSLQSNWQLALTPLLNLSTTADTAQRKKAITGNVFLDVQIPTPMKIFALGKFSGQSKIDVEIAAGHIDRYSIAADINGEQLSIPEAWHTMGLQVDAAHLSVQSKVEDKVSLASLPIKFLGTTAGALQTTFSGHLLIDAFAKKIIVDQLTLNGKATYMQPHEGYEFKNMAIDVQAVGFWQPDAFSFGLSEASQFLTDINIENLSLNAKSVRLMAKQLGIAGSISQGKVVWPQLHIDSNASLSIDKLSHPQLRPTSWRWQGKTEGMLDDFDATGDLGVGSALSVQHHLTLKKSELHVDWKIADLFLLAANPFEDTLNAWPPLLSLARGRLKASGDLLFDINNSHLKKSNTDIELQDIAGVYDTIIFEGVNTRAKLTTLDKTLKMSTDEVKINQLNKGFNVGPLVAAANRQKSVS